MDDLREAREFARIHHKPEVRKYAKEQADLIAIRSREFGAHPTSEKLMEIIGLWAGLRRFMALHAWTPGPTNPPAGTPVINTGEQQDALLTKVA